MRRHLLLSAWLLISACSQGDFDNYPERLDRMRTLGSQITPLVSEPSTVAGSPHTATMKVYVAVPVGETLTVEPYTDPAESMYPVVTEQRQINTTEEDLGKMRLVTLEFEIDIPMAEDLNPYLERQNGGTRLQYSFRLKTEKRTENVIGHIMVYKPGSPELTWSNPTIDDVQPVASASVTNPVTVMAAVSSANDEELKSGWFVSTGKVVNRRSRTTEWRDAEMGEQVLIYSVRGRKSRGFALATRRVTVE